MKNRKKLERKTMENTGVDIKRTDQFEYSINDGVGATKTISCKLLFFDYYGSCNHISNSLFFIRLHTNYNT